jgi:putative DNA primase/helicase
VKSWRATGNALEAVAALHSGVALFLDELREVEPREIVQTVLMLGNGSGKQRMRTGGSLRAALTWLLMFMSTGERRVEELAALVGVPVDAGAGVRLVEIPVPEAGAFDDLHGISDGATFAETIRAAALENYGTAGPAWLEYLTSHRAEAVRFLRECSRELLDAWLERATDAGQVARVAGRFALVAAAGELATRAGITGWRVGESEGAVRRLFDDWLAARGTRGDAEALAAVRQVAALLGQHAESYFPWWHRAADDHRPNSPKRWGLRRMVTDEGLTVDSARERNAIFGEGAISSAQGARVAANFYIAASAFRDEICKGFAPAYVARVLHQRGYLVPETEKRLDRKERLPGIGAARCYVIKAEIFEDSNL